MTEYKSVERHYDAVQSRLEQLRDSVRDGDEFTATEIADQFDVSYRTANRYANTLDHEFGDIIYDYPRGFVDATDGKTLRSVTSRMVGD